MNKLAICNLIKQLAGIPGNPLTTLSGSSREMSRVAAWVDISWQEIQTQRDDWQWMRKPASFSTTAYKGSYTPTECGLTDFGQWRNDSFRSFLTSAGVGTEIWLQQYDYNSFRDYYLLGSRKITYSRPIAVAIAPDKSLVFGLSPDNSYTIGAEYYKVPQVLTLGTSIPEMPERFHMAIFHLAMIKHGNFIAAGEVIAEHQASYTKVMNKLEADQAPMIQLGSSFI